MQILASDYGIQFVVCNLNTQKDFEVKHVFQIIKSSGGLNEWIDEDLDILARDKCSKYTISVLAS